jgi:hypothetical protein
MNLRIKENKRAWLALVAFSLVASALAFGFAFQVRSVRISEVAQLAQAHLIYALKQKDDMAVIDWSRDLEKMENVLAFQASLNQTRVAEGGNRDFLSNPGWIGVPFRSIFQWPRLLEGGGESLSRLDFLLIYRSKPDPILCGFTAFLFCFLAGGWALLVVGPGHLVEKPHNDTLAAPSLEAQPPAKVLPAGPLLGDPDMPFLFLDKSYIIQQANLEASELLQKDSKGLVNAHLLDLTPDPRLMQAIKTGEATKLSGAFLSRPNLSVILKPDPNGFFLFLESA